MTTRAESAATTRRALLDAASTLLDRGGAEAVTLRDVGSGAGVSRTAAYRHFSAKEDLLHALAAAAWDDVTADLRAISHDAATSPVTALREALGVLVGVGRSRPHLYRLMFAGPGAEAALVPAVTGPASRAQDAFLVLVARVVGDERARPAAGLLLAAAHGVTDLELSGHLPREKWHADGDDLLRLLVATLGPEATATLPHPD